ncbi:E3 ubiquitin-protein ligase APD1-like isoform X2 [Pyrus communis]
MDDAGGARGVLGRRSFKQRLRLNGFGCCGATWGFGQTAAIGAREDEEDQEPQNLPPQERVVITVGQAEPVNIWNPDCVAPVSNGSGMNLAAALAAERQFRDPQDTEAEGSVGPADNARTGTTAPGTPMRVSLMRLLEETEMDGCDSFGGGATADSEKAAEGGIGNDSMCCVCMARKKGAAFIPCGHTFCRVCSREVWLNRGSCPLCNRSILEILDIF